MPACKVNGKYRYITNREWREAWERHQAEIERTIRYGKQKTYLIRNDKRLCKHD